MTIDEILRHPPDEEIVFEGERLIELADALDNSGVCPPSIIENIKKAKRIRLSPVRHRLSEVKETNMGYSVGREWSYE